MDNEMIMDNIEDLKSEVEEFSIELSELHLLMDNLSYRLTEIEKEIFKRGRK